jgi:hypothetical protein
MSKITRLEEKTIFIVTDGIIKGSKAVKKVVTYEPVLEELVAEREVFSRPSVSIPSYSRIAQWP